MEAATPRPAPAGSLGIRTADCPRCGDTTFTAADGRTGHVNDTTCSA